MVKNIFILNEHLNVTKVLTLNGDRTFFDDLYSVDLDTGVSIFEFATNDNENIQEGYYVMFYYQNEYKLFQIIEIEEEHSDGEILLTCYTENACIELINNVVKAFSGDMNCIAFFEYILFGTRWQVGRYSASLIDNIQTVKVNKTTQIWTVIQDNIGKFNYEINPRVEYSNGHITGLFLDIFAEGELGNRTYKRFEYGRNVTGIIKKKDLYDWCTAIVIDVDCDITNIVLDENGYTKGDGSDTILATNENAIYNAGRNYIYGVYEGDESDGQEAVDNALKSLKERATPHFDYEVTTAMTYEEYMDIHIGDTVYVIDHDYSPILTLEARIGKLEISFTDRTKCKCTLTNYKEIKSKLLDEQYLLLNSALSSVSQTANKINWLINSGTSSGDMVLTQDMVNIVNSNVNITKLAIENVLTGDVTSHTHSQYALTTDLHSHENKTLLDSITKFEFNEAGELVIQIGDITKTFVPKTE